MAGLVTLSRALADGGAVVWEPADRPRLRVASRWAAALRREVEEVREVLRRAVTFRRQLEVSSGGPIPLLVLPEAPPPHLGACLSCGAAISSGWRCPLCLLAVYVALEAPPPPLSEDGAG